MKQQHTKSIINISAYASDARYNGDSTAFRSVHNHMLLPIMLAEAADLLCIPDVAAVCLCMPRRRIGGVEKKLREAALVLELGSVQPHFLAAISPGNRPDEHKSRCRRPLSGFEPRIVQLVAKSLY